jgi:hypothetical protein
MKIRSPAGKDGLGGAGTMGDHEIDGRRCGKDSAGIDLPIYNVYEYLCKVAGGGVEIKSFNLAIIYCLEQLKVVDFS